MKMKSFSSFDANLERCEKQNSDGWTIQIIQTTDKIFWFMYRIAYKPILGILIVHRYIFTLKLFQAEFRANTAK